MIEHELADMEHAALAQEQHHVEVVTPDHYVRPGFDALYHPAATTTTTTEVHSEPIIDRASWRDEKYHGHEGFDLRSHSYETEYPIEESTYSSYLQ